MAPLARWIYACRPVARLNFVNVDDIGWYSEYRLRQSENVSFPVLKATRLVGPYLLRSSARPRPFFGLLQYSLCKIESRQLQQ